MRSLLTGAIVAVTALGAPVASAAEWGDLKVRFVYGGDPPEPAKIQPTKDMAFCGQHDLVDESLLVHKENRGVRNVVMYVYTGRGGSKLSAVHLGLVGKQDVEIMVVDCRIEPHIATMQAGDDLLLNYSDDVGHNLNVSLFNNSPSSSLVPPGNGRRRMHLAQAEPAPMPIECNIHPWMKAYLIVTDHPYAAVSDENGVLVIRNLPAGDKLAFCVWHEVGNRLEGVEMQGSKVSRVGRIELQIAPGMNDLGEVTLPTELFRRD